MWLPEEDRFFETRGHMINTIKHMLGGRVAEELKLEDISTGASNDLERATELARQMITKYGFSEKLGPVSFSSSDEVFLGRDFSTRQNYSEEVASEVDREIRRLLTECYEDTRRILIENDAAFERVAQALLLVETLDGDQFERLFTGEADPESIRQEVEDEVRKIARRNKKEAEEAARIEEQERLERKEEIDRIHDKIGAADRRVEAKDLHELKRKTSEKPAEKAEKPGEKEEKAGEGTEKKED